MEPNLQPAEIMEPGLPPSEVEFGPVDEPNRITQAQSKSKKRPLVGGGAVYTANMYSF